jgi:hypothetical protein
MFYGLFYKHYASLSLPPVVLVLINFLFYLYFFGSGLVLAWTAAHEKNKGGGASLSDVTTMFVFVF